MDERGDRITRTSDVNPWRAGCGESRTSGSEGGPEKPTSREVGRALRSDPYTGEALAGLLRAGNAGANCIADHLAVLDAAIAQLPPEVSVGHRSGDDAEAVGRAVQVRTDSAGCSARFAGACRDRNAGFALVARSNQGIHAAISRIEHDKSRWEPALCQDGEARKGAAVAEVSDLVARSGWPKGTRLIVCREPLHPGAQTSLFPPMEYRYWATTPTPKATLSPSMFKCAPMPTSRTTSVASRTRGCAGSPSVTSTPTGPGWR